MPRLRHFDRTSSSHEPITSTAIRNIMDLDDDLITFNEQLRSPPRRQAASPDSWEATRISREPPVTRTRQRSASRDRRRRQSHSRRRSSSRSHSRNRRRRKEMEVRRFNGKDNVDEYLVQFEMAARYNGWEEHEMAAALLCALDGPARGVLSEFDDPQSARYSSIKRALKKRFNPADVEEIHEQALSQLRLQRGQNIRELAQEVGRLTRKAYPGLEPRQRERFAIKALLNAISDRETVFYIKDKNPRDMEEACSIFERYEALTGQTTKRGVAARSLRTNDADATDDHLAIERVRQEMKVLQQETDKRLEQLTDALTKLSSTVPTQPTTERPDNTIQKKPCPRCHRVGHWARDCPQPNSRKQKTGSECLECGEFGHRWRECPNQGNGTGPSSAPNARSQAPPRRQ